MTPRPTALSRIKVSPTVILVPALIFWTPPNDAIVVTPVASKPSAVRIPTTPAEPLTVVNPVTVKSVDTSNAPVTVVRPVSTGPPVHQSLR